MIKVKSGLFLAILIIQGYGNEPETECVKFSETIPSFSEKEKRLFEKYYPQMTEADPIWFLGSYLSAIDSITVGYRFHFQTLENIRSHECPDFITLFLDGGFYVLVDLKKMQMIWGGAESEKSGQIFPLKRK